MMYAIVYIDTFVAITQQYVHRADATVHTGHINLFDYPTVHPNGGPFQRTVN